MTNASKDDQLQEAFSSPDAAESSTPVSQSDPSITPRSEIQVDDSKAMVCYANFCRVMGTPEELILDFGLNARPIGVATDVEITQRPVLNYFTAKRLLHALAMSLQRHEYAFGTLETDVQKRVSPRHRHSGAPI